MTLLESVETQNTRAALEETAGQTNGDTKPRKGMGREKQWRLFFFFLLVT